ncbi:MAG: hypothetical protein ACJ8FY_00730 [Gemmataceae bacterium]
MDSQQEIPSPPLEQPSFFGLPADLRLWARLGATFWGGALTGFGIGLLVPGVLAELGVQRPGVVGGIGALLAAIGQVIALRAVRRSLQPDKTKPLNP